MKILRSFFIPQAFLSHAEISTLVNIESVLPNLSKWYSWHMDMIVIRDESEHNKCKTIMTDNGKNVNQDRWSQKMERVVEICINRTRLSRYRVTHCGGKHERWEEW